MISGVLGLFYNGASYNFRNCTLLWAAPLLSLLYIGLGCLPKCECELLYCLRIHPLPGRWLELAFRPHDSTVQTFEQLLI